MIRNIIFGYPDAMNNFFRILERSNEIFWILEYPGYFVRFVVHESVTKIECIIPDTRESGIIHSIISVIHRAIKVE